MTTVLFVAIMRSVKDSVKPLRQSNLAALCAEKRSQPRSKPLRERAVAKKQQANKKGVVWYALVIATIVTSFLSLGLFAACRKPVDDPPIKVEGNVQLYISMKEDDPDPSNHIWVDNMSEQVPTTLADIPADLTQGLGDKSDRTGRTYFAFSYYLMNLSDYAISYETCVNIEEAKGTILDSLRVMVIEGDKSLQDGDVYAKPETTFEGRDVLKEHTDYTTQPFVSDSLVCRRNASNFAQGTKIKQTVLVWIEGWDIDCNETILASSVKMSVTVTGARQ